MNQRLKKVFVGIGACVSSFFTMACDSLGLTKCYYGPAPVDVYGPPPMEDNRDPDYSEDILSNDQNDPDSKDANETEVKLQPHRERRSCCHRSRPSSEPAGQAENQEAQVNSEPSEASPGSVKPESATDNVNPESTSEHGETRDEAKPAPKDATSEAVHDAGQKMRVLKKSSKTNPASGIYGPPASYKRLGKK